MTDDTTERELREQINDLVRARARAESEAGRLEDRARLPGADGDIDAIAERYRGQAARLAGEVEAMRTLLRGYEADTERRRADDAGA